MLKICAVDVADERWDENANFIANARQDIPRLIARDPTSPPPPRSQGSKARGRLKRITDPQELMR
ncbi:hypothetical protein [Streptomyces sp. T028]|uniref:hypothetical protein n=1 Tax=Streptomyces sp. T028 TaxID=3394379 RepID=UPI003A87371D